MVARFLKGTTYQSVNRDLPNLPAHELPKMMNMESENGKMDSQRRLPLNYWLPRLISMIVTSITLSICRKASVQLTPGNPIQPNP